MTEENVGEVRVLQRTGGITFLEAKWEFPPKKHKTEYAKICSEKFMSEETLLLLLLLLSSIQVHMRISANISSAYCM